MIERRVVDLRCESVWVVPRECQKLENKIKNNAQFTSLWFKHYSLHNQTKHIYQAAELQRVESIKQWERNQGLLLDDGRMVLLEWVRIELRHEPLLFALLQRDRKTKSID